MSKKRRKVPAGLPAVKMPEDKPEIVPEVPVPETTETLQVEEAEYQIEQDTVFVTDTVCPRCGSPERTAYKEIVPRIYNDRGCVIRYRTKCLGRINPVDKGGNPVVDADGNPVSYECGNRYIVKRLVPRAIKSAS